MHDRAAVCAIESAGRGFPRELFPSRLETKRHSPGTLGLGPIGFATIGTGSIQQMPRRDRANLQWSRSQRQAGERSHPAPVKSRFLLSRGGACRFLDLHSAVLPNKNNGRGHHPMPTKDGFTPKHPLPLFLAAHDEPGVEEAWERAVISSRILKTCSRNGVGDRVSIDGKSSNALCGRHGFADRQIGSSACQRSIDAHHSINLRRSGFAADGKKRAGAR